MKIAQVSPLFESVPPKMYGGTERVVSWLTEELVRQGHDVTLFASGDSITKAHLVPITPRSLRLDPECVDEHAHITLELETVIQQAHEFDLVHWHTDYACFPYARRMATPNVSTLHGRLDIPDLQPLYNEFSEIPVISISDAQRLPLPWVNWQGTVYHGLPEDLFRFQPKPGKYLVFLGRISPEKGVDRAIEIARLAGMQLKIAAKVSQPDRPYFEQVIKPLIDSSPNVEWLGEITEKEKEPLLGNAYAMLFPIDWPEPFGIVMIEAMACGTPIIAFPGGSVQELMEDGTSGFVVSNVPAAVQALERVQSLDRRTVRRVFEKRFTARIMANNYLRIYAQLVENRPTLLPVQYQPRSRHATDHSIDYHSPNLPTG